jgi:hypothetical protein
MESSELINVTWWLVGATFTAAIVALFISVFDKWLRSLIYYPILDLECDLKQPNCEKTWKTRETGDKVECYYFRILVKNNGRAKAESIELLATELLKKHTDGQFHKIESFIPMNLTWTHSFKNKYYPAISKNMFRHCDLGYILNPKGRHVFINEDDEKFDKTKTVFSLELEVKPNSLQHLVGPGIYRLKIIVASSNTKPVEKIIEINHIGNWIDDEQIMFNEGIGIKLIKS